MNKPQLELTDAPGADDEAFVIAQVRAHNTGFAAPDARRLCVFARDQAGAIVGGLTGRTFWHYLDVAFLWVSADHRGSGLGTQLLGAAEAEALKRGCRHALLDTFSFQALPFYERLGYEQFGQLGEFAGKHLRHYLRKDLRSASTGEAGEAPFPELETERLWLREILDEDAPALWAIHGHAELMRWYGSDPLPDLEAARKLVRNFANQRTLSHPGVRWGVEIKGEPGLVGTAGLFRWDTAWRRCFVGYELALDAQGRGYMREALSQVLDWGFANMHLHRIEAHIHPDNLASLKLARSLGFSDEGTLREVGYWCGRHHDMVQMALLSGEWQGAATNEPASALAPSSAAAPAA